MLNFGKDPKVIALAKSLARELRVHQTKGEELFWQAVRNKRFLNLKFYRQHPLFLRDGDRESFIIADFYCHELHLMIEIDGKIHEAHVEYDRLRDIVVESCELKVIRIRNEEIEGNLED